MQQSDYVLDRNTMQLRKLLIFCNLKSDIRLGLGLYGF